ncbi:alpha-amylase family glycosyl hydrolase [Catenovulum sediminis]|uniref:Alpha-amylase family glycosyl hydrolase n=1 Tax=Catenovulum sediminis TaxID=1740262 RepID=A0ABV1RK60_9ALTE|nr:alpha-amylase family glycosyl hydrolase [Catenovulum sediminis]
MFKLNRACYLISSALLLSTTLSACKDTRVDIETDDNNETETETNHSPLINQFTATEGQSAFEIEFNWQVNDLEDDDLSCELFVKEDSAAVIIDDCSVSNNYTHLFASAGTYTAKLIVSDGELSKEQSTTITITEPVIEEPTPTFSLDAGVQASDPLYLRGYENNWDPVTQLTYSDGLYTIEFEGDIANQSLKVASAEWSNVNCGDFVLTANTDPVDVNCDANSGNGSIEFDGDAKYQFAFSYQPDGTSQAQLLKIEPEPVDESGLGQAGTVEIHYLHASESYDGWGLHLWGDAIDSSIATSWDNPRGYESLEADYAIYEVPIEDAAAQFNFIMHFGNTKSAESDLTFTPADFGSEVWIVQDNATLFDNETDARAAYDTLLEGLGNASDNLDLADVSMTNLDSSMPDGWVDSAQFAQIYVRAYQDSDGDGVGDIQGLISRLDYLKDNGVNGIWLMPMMESSDNDHGYATTDYRAIETDYGSLDDFKQLISEAHNRDIAIVMDYVINHSSNENPLFIDAMSSASNDKRDWYVIEESKPIGWNLWGADPWKVSPSGSYYAAFTDNMPDFDLTNPEVIAFHQNNLKFWLNLGVDGFRFDAVGVLVENGKDGLEDQPENHVVMKSLKDVIESYDNRYIVCESPSGYQLFANENSCGRAFNFSAGHAIIGMVKSGVVWDELLNELARDNIDKLPLILANHDFFAGDRVWNQLNGDETQYKLAAASYLLASANPYTYYGEEIGIAAATNLSGDWSIRTPMSWTDDATHAGFSSAAPFRELSANSTTHNVAEQLTDDNSLLAYYRSIYALRSELPIISTGNLSVQSQGGDSTLVLVRSKGNQQVVIVINYSNQAHSETVTNLTENSVAEAKLGTEVDATTDANGQLSVVVPAQSAVVYHIQPLQ